jgi:hypothetical protein
MHVSQYALLLNCNNKKLNHSKQKRQWISYTPFLMCAHLVFLILFYSVDTLKTRMQVLTAPQATTIDDGDNDIVESIATSNKTDDSQSNLVLITLTTNDTLSINSTTTTKSDHDHNHHHHHSHDSTITAATITTTSQATTAVGIASLYVRGFDGQPAKRRTVPSAVYLGVCTRRSSTH